MTAAASTWDAAVRQARAGVLGTESGAIVDDRQLVQRCLTGDAAAWQSIVAQNSRRIYNLCYRFTGNTQDAEDLSQEVFVRVYRTLSSFSADQGSLKTWIGTVTRNLLIDHYRRTKYQRVTDSIDDDEAGIAPLQSTARGPETDVFKREMQEQVQHALTRLSPELREALILRDLQDMDYKEIASVLKVPEGTVKSRINRGRVELARLLKYRLGH